MGPESRDPFELAGEAATLLEERGFVAVARKRDGMVMLEIFRNVGQGQRSMRYVLSAEFDSADELVQRCVAQFEAAQFEAG